MRLKLPTNYLKGNTWANYIETYQSMAQKFNVRSIPTLILFKDGKEVDRFVGVKSKDFLLKAMK